MRKSRLLTHAKAARIRGRRPAVIKGTALNPPAATAAKYRAALLRMVDEMTAATEQEVASFFRRPAAEKHFCMDESVSHGAGRLVSSLERRFAALFDRRADSLADWLARSVDKASSASLHTSLKDLSGGLSLRTTIMTGPIKETMIALTAQNVGLIRSIATDYLHGVEQAVLRSITTGNGLADLQPYLEKQAGATKDRARLIAEDQTRKAYAGINAQRMTALGLNKFEWVHSGGGQHPRELHVSYDGKIFDFSDPPVIDERTGETGIPGQAINCRCKAIPVISADEVG